MPFPDLDVLQQYGTLEEAMEAYAIYAKDNGYAYLVSWRIWLHVASFIRKAFQEEPATDASEDTGPRPHFSKRMSILRNRLIEEVFGEDGLDRIGTSLAVYNTALRAAQENNCLLYTSPSPRDMRRSRMPSSA